LSKSVVVQATAVSADYFHKDQINVTFWYLWIFWHWCSSV